MPNNEYSVYFLCDEKDQESIKLKTAWDKLNTKYNNKFNFILIDVTKDNTNIELSETVKRWVDIWIEPVFIIEKGAERIFVGIHNSGLVKLKDKLNELSNI